MKTMKKLPINPDSDYPLLALKDYHPIFKVRGDKFIYYFREHHYPELFRNYSRGGMKPRWFIKGSNINKILRELEN